MCYDIDARPPSPPIAGGAADTEDLVLTSKDGTQFAAMVARAEQPAGVGMVILPDVRGLFRFYEELALRFAEQGINAVAFDYFGRTAGVAKRDADFSFMDHIRQTKGERIAEDVAACLDYLKSPDGGSCTSLFTVGFCFGGAQSWLQATHHRINGAIGFYGMPGPSFADGAPGPLARAEDMEAPILGLMGGADQAISADDVAAFDNALSDHGVKHELITYPGAPHSFFDRAFDEHKEACDDAWRRILAFVEENK